MTLSDAQLDAYGLPSHQVLNEDPQKWSDLLAHAKHHYCDSSTQSGSSQSLAHPSGVAPNSDPCCSHPFWSGYVATQGTTYEEAVLDFTVPNVLNGPAGSSVTIWAGLGGGNGSGVLVQAGVQSTPGANPTNRTWWEVYPDIQVRYFNNPNHTDPRAGDRMHIYVSSRYAGENYNFFIVQDYTQSWYDSIKDTTYRASDATTGECILERPLHSNGQPYSLSQFNPQSGNVEQLSGCEISNGTHYQGVGLWPHTGYYMTADGSTYGKVLVYYGSLTNNGQNFSLTWEASS
jgi:hypothetical protein